MTKSKKYVIFTLNNNKNKKGKNYELKKDYIFNVYGFLDFYKFFCSAVPVSSKKRIAFVGDPMSTQQYRIADRIKQINNSDVCKVIDDKKLYKKFNIGLKEYIDFNEPVYRIMNNKRKHFLKNLSLNIAVIVVSYTDYNIQNVVEQYIQDIDTDNVSVMLVGHICGDNNGSPIFRKSIHTTPMLAMAK